MLRECSRNVVHRHSLPAAATFSLSLPPHSTPIPSIPSAATPIPSIPSAAKSVEEEQDSPEFLLIGFSKDLSDCNLKENVKQRKNSGKALNPEEMETADQDPENASPRVTITRRGPFYQDSFFEDARPDHQAAVEQMLDRWVDIPSVLITERNPRHLCNFDRFHNTLSNYRSLLSHDYFDDFTCYKTLRHRSPKEESQASSVSDLEQEYKIVLDVHGFSVEDISIRAKSHNELVVEGKVEQTGSTGALSCHKFSKHFILPMPVRMNQLTAALSQDDILTISVPKNSVLRIMHRVSYFAFSCNIAGKLYKKLGFMRKWVN